MRHIGFLFESYDDALMNETEYFDRTFRYANDIKNGFKAINVLKEDLGGKRSWDPLHSVKDRGELLANILTGEFDKLVIFDRGMIVNALVNTAIDTHKKVGIDLASIPITVVARPTYGTTGYVIDKFKQDFDNPMRKHNNFVLQKLNLKEFIIALQDAGELDRYCTCK